ncbi:dihydrodipicolinate synthase family protein [Jiella sp. MQZ9-1]|uniref:Dihydrodipicolinate synthase family protein n=1 Tax=Jiella flava TaxID=2816857 RepID=A0A939G2T1_9HYPH|nr:dihydrodipicolinate synthase family protein [Jiella flava]MBO0664513.1 dihydrodipicolinate synthase family protein [Jiella flava]MCD2473156.1 dihydrodipicolinate synthase family protein [Jiella flava]
MYPPPSASCLADPLFVPVLTHYRIEAPGGIDAGRMLAQIRHIRSSVRQVMLAGSTGDGWELKDSAFDALIDLAATQDIVALDLSLIFGALRPTTEAVIARLQHLENRLSQDATLKARVSAAVICPPVDPDASQAAILDHYEAVFAASELPIAVYQLPQVTGCVIAPETFASLAAHPRVTLFKDSSGQDAVARSDHDYGTAALVRGAEGGYLDALKPIGPYDGWLLSTGNVLGGPLRQLLALKAAGEIEQAEALSQHLAAVVGDVFAAAADEGGANVFSNANRAMDHLAAYGETWRDAPLPLKVDGQPLSAKLIDRTAGLCGDLILRTGSGYLG